MNQRGEAHDVSIEAILTELGDKSFGWALLLFALVNMLPMPIGSTMVTALPLLLLSAQMGLGCHHVRLPSFITQRWVNRSRFRRVVLYLKPILRLIEKVIRPRHLWLFQRDRERVIGVLLFCVSFALFLPIPLSGWLPAISVLVTAFGLIERDGVITLAGLTLGVVSITVTAAVIVSLIAGAQAIL